MKLFLQRRLRQMLHVARCCRTCGVNVSRCWPPGLRERQSAGRGGKKKKQEEDARSLPPSCPPARQPPAHLPALHQTVCSPAGTCPRAAAGRGGHSLRSAHPPNTLHRPAARPHTSSAAVSPQRCPLLDHHPCTPAELAHATKQGAGARSGPQAGTRLEGLCRGEARQHALNAAHVGPVARGAAEVLRQGVEGSGGWMGGGEG